MLEMVTITVYSLVCAVIFTRYMTYQRRRLYSSLDPGHKDQYNGTVQIPLTADAPFLFLPSLT